MTSSLTALNAVNFFMADVRDGSGRISAFSCKRRSGRRTRSAR